jgi:hypothetical protein
MFYEWIRISGPQPLQSSTRCSTRDVFSTALNVLSEHNQDFAMPPNVNHPSVVRAWATDYFNDFSRWNCHGNSLFIDGLDCQSIPSQTKTLTC